MRRQRDEPRVRLGVVRDDHRRLVQREAAGALPGAVVDAERVAERGAPGRAEHAPRGDHVGGRIADPDPAEVDDRAEPAAVRRAGWAGAGRCGSTPASRPTPAPRARAPTRRWPRRCRSTPPDEAIAARVPASSSRSGRRPPRGAPSAASIRAQLGHEPREVAGRLTLVVDERVRVRLAVDPAVDRPGERVRARPGDPSRPARGPAATGAGRAREPVPLLSRSSAHSRTRGSRTQRWSPSR